MWQIPGGVPLCLSSPLGPGGFPFPLPPGEPQLSSAARRGQCRSSSGSTPPGPPGWVEPLRALHIDLSSTAEEPAATGGEEEPLLHVAGLAGPNLEGKRLRSRNQAAWEAEAGFARWRFSSAIMVRQTWSARRRFRHRLASRSVLPSAIFVR